MKKKDNGFANAWKELKEEFPIIDKIIKIGSVSLMVIILMIVIFNIPYHLNENEQAIITTFGQAKTESSAGLHFKIPFIQKVKKVNTSIKGFPIGYSMENDQSISSESLMITKDYNFVNIDFYVSYQITNPIDALYNTENVELVLKNMAQTCIRSVVASYNVDPVMTTGKSEIEANVKDMLIKKTDEFNLGVTIKDVNVQDAEPPTEAVSTAFKGVETAKQGKETAINNANKYANEVIPAAEANADKIVQSAEAEKTAKINEAEGQVARFNSLYEEYTKYPLITKQRMFYETMEEVLPNMKVIILNNDGTQTVLPLDSFTQE